MALCISSGRTTFAVSNERSHVRASQQALGARPRCVPIQGRRPVRRTGGSAERTLSVQAAATGARLVGVGSAVPKGVLTNMDLAALVDTNDEWIASRTGIRQRHILGEGETLTQLATDAARHALEMGGCAATDIDLILLCTSSPEDSFGGACLVQAALGATNAAAFDITAACSGFVLGLVSAVQYIRSGSMRNVLVIGADALSRYVDWRDRGTCILFGDGCGAVLLQAAQGDCSLLSFDMNSDGLGNRHLTAAYCTSGVAKPTGSAPSDRSSYANIAMNGQEVFKFAVRNVPVSLQRSLDKAGLDAAAINFLVMHQANQRILDAVGTKFGIAPERIVSNIAKYGNTSAASIPLALDEAVREGKIKKGDLLATAGFGAGLSWASALIKWG